MGHRSLIVAQAHEKYGPIVRMGPDELSFSDRSCLKELYLRGSKFPKSGRYDGFATGTRASFDMTDPESHRERRQLVRHVLASSHIDQAEPLIADQVRKCMNWVARSQGQSVEVMLLLRRLMLDTAGALFLGAQFGALENEEQPKFLDDMDDFFTLSAIRWNAPWMLRVLRILPVRSIQHFLGAQQRSMEYGRRSFDEYITRYGRYSGRRDLLTKMVGLENKGAPMTDEEIVDELGSLLVGATDTTVTVATWMLWELAKHPDWQQRVREELRENRIKFIEGVPTAKSIASLPILDGVIMESMRLHPAQAIGLPRIARYDGNTIGGMEIPAGTTVSIQSRNVHRDPEVYPSPAEFLPERWIETHGGTQEMKDSFIIFSKGSRACLGQYVALMELKFIVASLLNGWNIHHGAETTSKTMGQDDYFLAFPKSRQCHLVFEKVNE
ncbi:MAG: hypothetical protein LQ338_002235 [Usnochroma carphineum]|nr:MAG: hypothetical protein LQ338_002235 [Usnochroma carphineum]